MWFPDRVWERGHDGWCSRMASSADWARRKALERRLQDVQDRRYAAASELLNPVRKEMPARASP